MWHKQLGTSRGIFDIVVLATPFRQPLAPHSVRWLLIMCSAATVATTALALSTLGQGTRAGAAAWVWSSYSYEYSYSYAGELNSTESLEMEESGGAKKSHRHKVSGQAILVEISRERIFVGIGLAVLSSMGSSAGNCIQHMGLAEQAMERRESRTSIFWIGTALFALSSAVNAAALGSAPTAVVVPLEAGQLISSFVWSRVLWHGPVPRGTVACSLLIVLGLTITIYAGPREPYSFTMGDLERDWASPLWVAYVGSTIVCAILAQLTHMLYRKKAEDGRPLRGHATVFPLSFAISSSSLGVQSVVQSKCMAQLLNLAAHGVPIFSEGYFYVVATLLLATTALWALKLSYAIEKFDSTLMIPLLISHYIAYAVIGGGIYFKEYQHMTGKQSITYATGLAIVFSGLISLGCTGTTASQATFGTSFPNTTRQQSNANDSGYRDHSSSSERTTGSAVSLSATLLHPVECRESFHVRMA